MFGNRDSLSAFRRYLMRAGCYSSGTQDLPVALLPIDAYVGLLNWVSTFLVSMACICRVLLIFHRRFLPVRCYLDISCSPRYLNIYFLSQYIMLSTCSLTPFEREWCVFCLQFRSRDPCGVPAPLSMSAILRFAIPCP